MRDFDVGNGRVARLYVDDAADAAALSLTAAPSELEEFVQSQYWDEDDIERSTILDSLVRRGTVHADVYPAYRDSNTLKVYLRSDGAPVFACSLLPMARLRQLLKQTPMVLEGFTTQIVPTEQLSVEEIKAAIQQWIERGFPNATPVITVERPDRSCPAVTDIAVTAAQLREIMASRSVELQVQLEKFTPDVQLSMPVDGDGVRLRVSVAPGEEAKIPKTLDLPFNGSTVRIPLEARPDLQAYEPYRSYR